MEKSPAQMIDILPEGERTLARGFIDLGERLGCRARVRYATAHKAWKCVFSRVKPTRVLFTVECTDTRWHVKACLWNIDRYGDAAARCGNAIQSVLTGGYECRACSSRCKGGAAFTLAGVAYKKCVGCCFYFSALSQGDWTALAELITLEYETGR